MYNYTLSGFVDQESRGCGGEEALSSTSISKDSWGGLIPSLPAGAVDSDIWRYLSLWMHDS